ncbi:MAG: nicotinate (nicotinamide) nucleotide adenylyltransferase [Desulfonatronovibrio sp. MSAO_Bac4]|nr:MAG: nicotinate (nicotinamide) nucleotide adenylyltransferase [Desulfonatronovibrio sp. MSAO_Bac4]
MNKNYKKIGLLGGSFNPLHIGHLRLCVEMLEQAGLDEVQLVPAYNPPHKNISNILPFEMRCSIIEQAIENSPGISLNRLEKKRTGPSYTYDMLSNFKMENPDSSPAFIMGDNDLLTMPHWYRGAEILRLSDLLIVGREGCGMDQVHDFILNFWPAHQKGKTSWSIEGGNDIRYFSVPRLDLSSSLVRSRWLESKCIDWLMPPSGVRILNHFFNEIESTWRKS